MKRILTIVTAMSVTTALATPASAQTPEVVNGDVAYFQDFKEFEPRIRDGGEFGGVARLAHVLETLTAQEGDPAIAMGGDVAGGSSFNSIYKGAPFIEAFNELGVDVGNFGNHDFDYGAEHALELVELADFDWISSNLVTPDGAPFSPDGTVSVQQSGDLRLGFVSLTTDLDRTSAAREVLEADLIDSARRGVENLEGQDVDAIILLTQVSRVNTIEVMEAVPELDAALREENGASLPAEIHRTSDGRYIVGPDADYGAVVHLDITTNRATGETVVEPDVIRLDSTVPEDESWAARSDTYYQQLDDQLGGVIAHTGVDLDRAELGVMVADSYRRHFGTQLGWQNGGGIRAELSDGEITLRDAYSVLPFGNKAVAIEATGEEILLGLEQGIESNPAGGNGFPRVAGLAFEFEADASFGERVTAVTLEDGSALDPSAIYTVAISQFLQEGGDGTTAFLGNTLVTPKMVTDVDAFAALLRKDYSGDSDGPVDSGSSIPAVGTAGMITSAIAAVVGLLEAVAGPVADSARQILHKVFGSS